MSTMTYPKAWEILQVSPGASEDQIRAAFRLRAKELHPDAGGTREQWDQLEAAYVRLMIDASHGADEAYDTPPRKAYWKWRGLPRISRLVVIAVTGGALLAGGGWAFVSWAAGEGIPWAIPALCMYYPGAVWVWLMVCEARRPAAIRKRWYLMRMPTNDKDLDDLIKIMADREERKTK